MDPITFDGDVVRLVCISDTHNEDPTPRVPDGDIFIHAGDMTDGGSFDELHKAFKWIADLPHKVKVVIAGNHDLGLDKNHSAFSAEALDLFTSSKACNAGIHYVNQETQTVAYYRSSSVTNRGASADKDDLSTVSRLPIRIYGNPMTPDFLNSQYAFTYKPAPSESADKAWSRAPDLDTKNRTTRSDLADRDITAIPRVEHVSDDYVAIDVTHGAPLHHLDKIEIPGLSGCPVQEAMVERTRPLLCVFGHYHVSNGVETVQWDEKNSNGEAKRSYSTGPRNVSEPSQVDGEKPVVVDVPADVGKSTTFINAAWIPHTRRDTEKRNSPYIVRLHMPPSELKPRK